MTPLERLRNRRREEGSPLAPFVDASFNLLFAIIVAFLIAVIFMAIRIPPQPKEEVALEVIAVWDVALPSRSPEITQKDTQRTQKLEAAGAYLKPGHSRADVDLWALYEADDGSCELVGFPSYLRKGKTVKLDEDDRGWDGRFIEDDVNREVLSAKVSKLPKGRWMFSTHLFGDRQEIITPLNPTVVELNVVINKGMPGMVTKRWRLPLRFKDDEIGILFEIDDEGMVVPGSFIEPTNDIFIASRERSMCGDFDFSGNAAAAAPYLP